MTELTVSKSLRNEVSVWCIWKQNGNLILEELEVLSPLLDLLGKLILDDGALLRVVDLQVKVYAKEKTNFKSVAELVDPFY
jgi:hypothetical protein